LKNNHVLKKKEFLSFENMVAPQGNLSLVPLGTWLPFEEQFKPFFNFGNLFSSISFMDEKDNSGKGSNPKPLGCKKDSNHCISFHLLKIN
jgi:hypothetical protein